MFPSTNFLALIRAYDLDSPVAKSRDEMRLYSQLLLDKVHDEIKALSSLFPKSAKSSVVQQNRFDALLSLAYDVGLDAFFASPLPDTVRCRMYKSHIRDAFCSLPEFNGTLRPEHRRQLALYSVPQLSRRQFEAELFFGNVFFTFGRTTSDNDGCFVFSSIVVHPIIQFMMRG